MADRLRLHWDFGDLDGTERRLRAALGEEASDAGRAEVLTQLARVDGLRGDIGSGDGILDEAAELAGSSGMARARIDLERGRLRRSSGTAEDALPLFESAFATASDAEEWFVAADAAHMAALAAPDRAGIVEWTGRGLELAEEHTEAAYWAGPLLNNLGWEYYEARQLADALAAFAGALVARERDPGNGEGIALARYAVGKTLRALGRSGEAVPQLERAAAWAVEKGRPDGWFHEELALEYAAVDRAEDARDQARLAIPLLEAADPSFAGDAERSGRLRSIAATQDHGPIP